MVGKYKINLHYPAKQDRKACKGLLLYLFQKIKSQEYPVSLKLYVNKKVNKIKIILNVFKLLF